MWIQAVIIGLIGSALHFVFELTRYNRFVGRFTPVNESTWEHLKLVYFPFMLLMFFNLYDTDDISKLVSSYLWGTLLAMVIIPLIFYFYQIFTHRSVLLFDITLYFIAVFAGQFAQVYLYQEEVLLLPIWSSTSALFIILIMFMLWTYYPPRNFLFQHPQGKTYGITHLE